MKWYLLVLILVIGGCASSSKGDKESFESDDDEKPGLIMGTISDTFEGAVDIIRSPFRDLGLMKQKIPDELEMVSDDPYVRPTKVKCETIVDEIVDLDRVLGSDEYLVASTGDEEGYFTSGAKMASSMAVGKLGGYATLPFKSMVRRVTGANTYERQASKAYQAGQLRRAYLIGMAESDLKCARVLEEKEKKYMRPAKKKNTFTI